MSRTVHCIKLGQDAEGLDRPPLPGPFIPGTHQYC